MDGGDRLVAEQLWLASDNRQVVHQILRHLVARETFEERAFDNPRGERARVVGQQPVGEDILPAQHDGHHAPLFVGQLGERLQMRKQFQA